MLQDLVVGILKESWEILAESAPWVLFGFLAAGLLKSVLREELVARHLGGRGIGSVVKASLFGVPLPLCSCGVIPAAIGLRRQGAGKGASAAFLVSTPESGVDSMAITWALIDPLMTLLRPLAAFFTATVTGILINRLPDDPSDEPDTNREGSEGCGEYDGSDAEEVRPDSSKKHLAAKLSEGMKYAFGELLGDIGKWLLLGILAAGLISYLVPDAFFTRYLDSEILSLLIMLAAGIPMYICASASTPIAAALILKGVSPGAALVFLLAGPATNVATVTVIGKFWGKKATTVYLGSIAGCSLLLGWLANRIYAWSGTEIGRWMEPTLEAGASPVETLSGILLLILIGWRFLPRKQKDPCG